MQCSEKLFGDDFQDFADISTEKDTKAGYFVRVLCEGCGFCMVDHTGKKVAVCLDDRSVTPGTILQDGP